MGIWKSVGQVADEWVDETARSLGARSELVHRLRSLLPAGYDELSPPDVAAIDLPIVAELAAGPADLATRIVPVDAGAPAPFRFRLYRRGAATPLADLLPLLDQLGLRALDETSFRFPLAGADGSTADVHLHDVGVQLPPGVDAPSEALLDEARHAFECTLRGDVEVDGLNRLVLSAGMATRDVEILRAFSRYLRQVGFPFGQQYIEAAVVRHAALAGLLVELFRLRLDPARAGSPGSAEAEVDLRGRIDAGLDAVPSLDDDRTLRALLALVDATTRTNVFRPGESRNGHRPVMAFKFDPAKVPDLPLPRPMFEIWVCSPRVEGVHLRGGRIARGGIRWSDRREDFRTEILGLVKAQMVKNAVIVPTGAKGGFVLKRPPADAEAFRAEGVACYREFIAGLLDLTDNLAMPAGTVVPPPHTVRLDADDPYLVVAADKGTASFSDIANEISAAYGFWLGDAFASGGSAGYDHKEMGITARGAWESVRRHARSIGKHADRDPLTIVGIGDMSGDVFGNGLLRSPHVRLVAAFDHRHVFLDPDPDPAASFAERKRLFDLPRSSWADYDSSLISQGGGVFARAAKSIEISPQAQRVLGVERAVFTPAELISAILRAPVDVLWNGGIGTYVKASTESHLDVGDRTNDALRVDGNQLRCKIVAEGGNLGFTQRGRIEYALNGGLVNTDAIDNSAGVDCSDHEVNIKILLADVMASTGMTVDERNALLMSMTDEVCELVLEDNIAQTLVLALARRRGPAMANVHARYLNTLEAEGWINRALEFLPTDRQLAERQAAGMGLTTPEFAVLLAYTKTTNIDLLIESTLPDDPYVHDELVRYFPPELRERYAEQIDRHRLRREIIATQLGNQMVNLSGLSFDHRITEDTNVHVVDITRAWVAARDVIGMVPLWEQIEACADLKVDAQLGLFLDLRTLVTQATSWIIRHYRVPVDIGPTVERHRAGVQALATSLDGALRGRMREQVFATEAGLLAAGVPEALAQRAALWPLLHTGFDVSELAVQHAADVRDVAGVYWHLFDLLDLSWLWDAIEALPRTDRWPAQAAMALRDELCSAIAVLVDDVLHDGSVDEWAARNERAMGRVQGMLSEIRRADAQGVTTLTVALRQMENLLLVSARP